MTTRVLHVFHNISQRPMRCMTGYEPDDPLVRVFDLPIPEEVGDDVLRWCEYAFMVLNVAHEHPAAAEAYKQAVAYRERKNRSLSVGDVLMVDGIGYKCASIGWEPVLDIAPGQITDETVWGTTPLSGPVPDWGN